MHDVAMGIVIMVWYGSPVLNSKLQQLPECIGCLNWFGGCERGHKMVKW